MSKADERHDITVEGYIESISDPEMVKDARTLLALFAKVSGEEPILYGIGTIGYGLYTYKYASGRKGEAHTLAFYPRKGKITIYLMDGTARYAELLSKLGPHTLTGYCVYIKRLKDIDLSVLEQILQASFRRISSMGVVSEILWQS